ncbi:putative transmembrane protein GPR107/GPR108 [Helianthus annuus]|nr:putative transmembrane protein GPR107/GPR108 [Helianthus annuus]
MVSPTTTVVPLLLFLFLTTTTAEIRYTSLRSDPRPIIPLDEFGFTHTGRLELNVTNLSFSSPPPDPTNLGFFLCTRDSWLHVLQQIEDGDVTCALQSDVIKHVYTFTSDSLTSKSLNQFYLQQDADQYTLVFANCLPQIKVTMDVRSAMYNLDGRSRSRDYLSAGITVLPGFISYSLWFTSLWLQFGYLCCTKNG